MDTAYSCFVSIGLLYLLAVATPTHFVINFDMDNSICVAPMKKLISPIGKLELGCIVMFSGTFTVGKFFTVVRIAVALLCNCIIN